MNVVLDRVWDIALELNKSVKLYNKHFVTTCLALVYMFTAAAAAAAGTKYLKSRLFRFI